MPPTPPPWPHCAGTATAAKTAHDKTLIQRQIDATDRQLDALAYALYGLTDEEIRMVEAAKAPA